MLDLTCSALFREPCASRARITAEFLEPVPNEESYTP